MEYPRRLSIGLAAICLTMVLLSGCRSGTQYEPLQVQVAALVEEKSTLEREIQQVYSDETTLKADYEHLQTKYQNLLQKSKQPSLENPTWAELREFLEWDDTDALPYIEGKFDCCGYAITLRDRAWRYGIRCAFIEVSFSGSKGHVLNAFETTDKGLIYVDVVGSDKMAYIEINQPYGTINLDNVRFEYVACTGDPTEFWTPLTHHTEPGPFSYDYYIDYRSRVEFYRESVEAYNKAVVDYENGRTPCSYSQLAAWHANLHALNQDLGSVLYKALSEVKNIEVYWN